MESEETRARKSEQIHRLPAEIVEDILSRLPVKSLLRSRSVSKSWRALIDSKRFIRTHLQISKRSTNLTHHWMINGIRRFSLYSLMNEPVTDSFKLDVQIRCPSSIFVVGCCDGLICFLVDKMHFLLCNPTTRMTKRLPALYTKSKQGPLWKYGFGFDESTGDYKVLGIMTVLRSEGGDESIGKVYSLKSNSWKTLQDWEGDAHTGLGNLVNGRLHWMSKFNIETFDLNSEVCGIVEWPLCAKDVRFTSLGVFDGCLCVVCDNPQTSFDFWIWKQYGVRESWSKLVTVPYLDHPIWKDYPLQALFITPLCIGPNKEILFACGGTFVIYYPEDNRCLYRQVNNLAAFDGGNIYIESLVSLLPDGEG